MIRSERDQRDAELAAVLAAAVRAGELRTVDALRVIKHEMRRRNTNMQARLEYRSAGAQRVVDDYARRGIAVPKNASDDALHADHVYELGASMLRDTVTVDEWHEALVRARTVVVVTARENYELEKVENAGVRGPAKYAAIGLTWSRHTPPFCADDVDLTDRSKGPVQ